MRNVEVEAGGNVFTIQDPGPQKFTDFQQWVGREAVVMQAVTKRLAGLQNGSIEVKGKYSIAIRDAHIDFSENMGKYVETMLDYFEKMVTAVNGQSITREILKEKYLGEFMEVSSIKIMGDIAVGILNKLGIDGETAKNL